ncbi:MAG: hypothetical protein ACHQRM_15000 [Bacteroidia bacterium]
MHNTFFSKVDVVFDDLVRKYSNEIGNEFLQIMDYSINKGKDITAFHSQIGNRKLYLYAHPNDPGRFTNQYKYDLVNTFNFVLKRERHDPMSKMLTKYLPHLKSAHLERMRIFPLNGYSYDAEFINAGADEIIDLLAKHKSFEIMEDHIIREWSYFVDEDSIEVQSEANITNLGPLKGKDQTESNNIQVKMINLKNNIEQIQPIIDTIYKHLINAEFIKSSYEDFTKHFQHPTRITERIEWHSSQRLIVHLFFELQKEITPKDSHFEIIINHFKRNTPNKKGEIYYSIQNLRVVLDQLPHSKVKDIALANKLY